MGHSQTIHVIGFSKEEKINEKTYRRHECHAMNKMEMVQKRKYMAKHGTPVVGWLAQTKTGCKMIGADYTWEEIPDSKVSHIKLIDCPICKAKGCFVCNHSGITKNNYWKRWQPWQLETV